MPAYFDNDTNRYLIESPSGLLSLTKSDMLERLAVKGLSRKAIDGVSEATRKLQEIQDQRKVDMVIPLAGWNKGIYEWSGKRIFVPYSPKLIVPKEGDWKIWERCLECAFATGQDPLQLITWKANELFYEQSLLEQKFHQRAINVIIGIQGGGKTFIQERKTEQITGRVANPWPHWNGLTPFNGDLFTAEHLSVGDPQILDRNDRGDFSNMVKQMTSEYQNCHKKFSEPVSLPPLWFSTLSCNPEMHNLAIRTLDASLRGKMNLFKCNEGAIPPPEYRHLSHSEFIQKVRASYPAYKWHLLNEFKVPKELLVDSLGRNERFGVRVYHHPELVELIESNLPEMRLLEVLDYFNLCQHGPWSGTYQELMTWLRDFDERAEMPKDLLMKEGLVKHYLGKLAGCADARVRRQTGKRKNNRQPGWIILPPNQQAKN